MHRNCRSLVAAVACAVALSCLPVQPASAQGTPWIAEPGTGSVSLSFVNQKASEFFRADTITKGPLEATGASLSQNTLWFGVNYAITDAVALDIQSGYARSFLWPSTYSRATREASCPERSVRPVAAKATAAWPIPTSA